MVEFQSFDVSKPMPTAKALMWLEDTLRQEPTQPEPAQNVQDEIAELAEKIRGQWSPTMSKNRVAQLLGWKQYGGGIMQTVNAVIEHLTATSTSTTQKAPKRGVLGAVEG